MEKRYLRENKTDPGTEFFRAKFWFYRKRKMREIWKNFIIKKGKLQQTAYHNMLKGVRELADEIQLPPAGR